MASTTQRPLEAVQATPFRQYEQPVNGVNRTSSHRRNQSQSKARAILGYPENGVNPPAAPDVPRAPPVAYRGPRQLRDPTEQAADVSRSFSARAKGMPFAQEAFVDDDDFDADEQPVEHIASDTRRRSYGRSTDPAVPSIPRIDPDAAPRQAPLPRQTSTSRRSVESRTVQPQQIPSSPPTRSSTVREPSNVSEELRREWAPDRSPLQKLEVTLNDISKEEKRARVEEAEMLLRESKSRRESRRVSRDSGPTPQRSTTQRPSVQEPNSLEEAGLVRSLSSKQRDRLQHSATVDTRRPDVRRLSAEGRRGFDYEDQLPQERGGSAKYERPLPQTGYAYDEVDNSPRQDAQPSIAKRPLSDQTSPSDVRRSVSARQQAVSHSPQNVTRAASARQASGGETYQLDPKRAVSLQQRNAPNAIVQGYDTTRRTGPMQSANSSHKAVLSDTAAAGTAGAVAAATTAAVGRSNSKKLQKAPPQGHGRTSEQRDERRLSQDQSRTVRPQPPPQKIGNEIQNDGAWRSSYNAAQPRRVNVANQGNVPLRTTETVDLGLREASADDSEHHKHRFSEMLHHKPRQQSVSFKEPIQGPRKLDEWKSGGVARLTLEDMDLQDVGVDKNKAWWETGGSRRRSSGRAQATQDYGQPYEEQPEANEFRPPLFLKCGPLLRYTGMRLARGGQAHGRTTTQDRETWRGSVLIVTQDSQSSYEPAPTLRLFSQPVNLLPPPPAHIDGDHGELAPEYVDPIAGLTKVSRTGKTLYVKPVDHLEEGKDLSRIDTEEGLFEESPSSFDYNGASPTSAQPTNRRKGRNGEGYGKFKELEGSRLYADSSRNVTCWRFNIEIELGEHQAHIAYRINRGPAIGFWVPARGQSMNIMFHSCNGFSLSVNPDTFGGPDPLWRDVLNTHQTRPFHVMIGGGDQIYNDRVMLQTQIFQEWTKIKNPHHKHEHPFGLEMKDELETFYLERYAMWFSQGLFGVANSQIPMVNIWDDHDIIDGFGSYPDRFMSTPVFKGLGEVAFKYYLLFQHHSVPEETQADEPSWLLGAKRGPYIEQLSRSVFMFLGKHVAFLGLDCRTERTRDEVLTEQTYDIVFDRCRREIVEGETKHLIVLLGVPIAYPRLVWLENVLTSRAMDPIKALGRAGLFGGLLNKFDGGVEILDDLDDHWTAAHHKAERNWFIEELQDLAAEKSVRITILGGDVHLAAIGQFYSNPRLKIPKDRDHRYMPNVISSAIVNTPPPEMMGDILNKRNKVHHLDKETDEDMIPMFTHDVDGRPRNNKRLLPRRNWCSIREYQPGSTPPPTPSDSATPEGSDPPPEAMKRRFSLSRDIGPGSLLRRLSQRGPPREIITPPDAALNGNDIRPISSGGVPRPSGYQQDGYFPPVDGPVSSAPLPRPGNFQRRPTNLSERAAKKGGPDTGVGLDENGEIINDHIDLEGGLDICLNCEVSRGDVAGITLPYRLLVPALVYDGEPDPNPEPYPKKSGFLRRLTVRTKGPSKLAASQGQGEWGKGPDSEDDTWDDNGVEVSRPKGKRRWF